MLVRLEILRDDHSAMTLTHTEIMTLHRNDLSEVALSYPAETKRLRHAAVLMAIYRASKIYSQEKNSGELSEEYEWIHAVFSDANSLGKLNANQHILGVWGTEDSKSTASRADETSMLVETIAEEENAPPPIGEARLSLEEKVDDLRKDMKGMLEAGSARDLNSPGLGPQKSGSQRNKLLFCVLEKLENLEKRLDDKANGKILEHTSSSSICNSPSSSKSLVPTNGSVHKVSQQKFATNPINGSHRSTSPNGTRCHSPPQGFRISPVSHAGSPRGMLSEPAEPTVPPEPMFLDDRDYGLSFGVEHNEGHESYRHPAWLLTEASHSQGLPAPPALDSQHLSAFQDFDSSSSCDFPNSVSRV